MVHYTEPVWKLDRYANSGWEFQGSPKETTP